MPRGRILGSTNRSVPHAIRLVTVKDLYWAAGFLEGEGCFSAMPSKSGHIEACQVNLEPLTRLAEIFGGNVVKRKGRNAKASDYWDWNISGSRARGVMLTLFLLLSNHRQAQIIKALS